ALPEPRADQGDPRPVDRQVHGARRVCAPRSQERSGGISMSTMTETTTQVYQLFIKATPEQIWYALVDPDVTSKYFYGSRITITPEGRMSTSPDRAMDWG